MNFILQKSVLQKVYSCRMDVTTVYSLSDEQVKGVEWICREAWLEMYKKNLFCDAILKTEDGGIFEVHK